MTNTQKLKIAMMKKNISYNDIALKIGTSTNTVYRKANNIFEFKASEIYIISKLLCLSDVEMSEIFFNFDVD